MTRFVSRSCLRNHSGRLVPPLSPHIERSLTSVRRLLIKTRRHYVSATVLFLAVAACSGSGSGRSADQNSRADTTTTTVASTTTAADPKAAVIEAYLAYWRAVNAYGSEVGSFRPGRLQEPVRAGRHRSAVRLALQQRLQVDRAQGLVYRGGENDQFRPRVVELQGDRAVIEDCADDTGGVFDTRSNTFTENTTPGQHSPDPGGAPPRRRRRGRSRPRPAGTSDARRDPPSPVGGACHRRPSPCRFRNSRRSRAPGPGQLQQRQLRGRRPVAERPVWPPRPAVGLDEPNHLPLREHAGRPDLRSRPPRRLRRAG